MHKLAILFIFLFVGKLNAQEFESSTILTFSGYNDLILCTADLDGDNDIDLATNTGWWERGEEGELVQFHVYEKSYNFSSIIPGDYDADGMTDLIGTYTQGGIPSTWIMIGLRNEGIA